jgi:hypothetical protein
MYQAGLQPGAIILMVYSHKPGEKNPVGRCLPKIFRPWYAEKHQELSHNYWPRQLKRTHPILFDSRVESLKQLTDDPADLLTQMLGKFDYSRSFEKAVRKVYLRSLKDQVLIESIKDSPYPTVLFTGGGIVPSEILSLKGIRILHTHPGHVPHVRGADGILWSTLVRGNPGASCFFFDETIDTGPVIAAQDFPEIKFHLTEGMTTPDDQTLYRMVFSYYDPILRAEMLVNTLERLGDVSELSAQDQDFFSGVTYHFMHPTVRREALSSLFESD